MNGKTTLRIEPSLLETFQKKVESTAGKLKGAQNDALNEAVLLWIGYRGEEKVVSVATKEGTKVVKLVEVKGMLDGFVRQGWDEGRGVSVKALFAPIENAEIVEMLVSLKEFKLVDVKFVADGNGEEMKLQNAEEISEAHRTDGGFFVRFGGGVGREFQLWASR
jgi:hypothetical protein